MRKLLILLAALVAGCQAHLNGADIGSPVPKDELTLVREQNEELLKQVAEIRATLAKLTAPTPAPAAPKAEAPQLPKVQAPVVVQYLPAQSYTTQVTTARTQSSGLTGKLKSALGCNTTSTPSMAQTNTSIMYTLAPSAGPTGGTTRAVTDCPPGKP